MNTTGRREFRGQFTVLIARATANGVGAGGGQYFSEAHLLGGGIATEHVARLAQI